MAQTADYGKPDNKQTFYPNPVGAVSNRTVAECLINSKVYHRCAAKRINRVFGSEKAEVSPLSHFPEFFGSKHVMKKQTLARSSPLVPYLHILPSSSLSLSVLM